MSDDVRKPAHYTDGSVEFIEAVESALGPEGFLAFCKGNALKYLWRCDRKGSPFKDVSKAHWYVCRWMEAYDRYEAKLANSGEEEKGTMTAAFDVIWSQNDRMVPPSEK